MNRYFNSNLVVSVSMFTILLGASAAVAVPYASAVVQTGNNVDFILNEPADTVTITRDGGSTVVINAAAAGNHSFDMTGFSTYEIGVTHSSPVGWVESPSSIANAAFLNFVHPTGLAVNKIPDSPYFGSIYVGNGKSIPTANGRIMGDGIYILNATGINAGGESLGDITAAKTGGGVLDFTLSNSSPWQISIGKDSNLYIADWSNDTGGVKYMAPDGSGGDLLLATAGGAIGGVLGGNHGSVVSKPVLTGSLGVDLTLWTMDQHLEGSVAGTGNHVWRYDIGTTTTDYNGPANLVLDASTEGTNSDGSIILWDSNIGVDADISRDPVHGNWIVNQPRNAGNETGLLILGSDANGNPDATNVLFNSKQFSIDNGLDGATDILFPEIDGIQDIFRYVSRIEVSPDGSTMAIHRRTFGANNLYLGTAPVLLVPLDANGVPVLDVSDPVLAPTLGVTEIPMVSTSLGFRKTLTYDLAGNLYAGSSSLEDEKVSIWGPGGDTTAITRSNGTFTLVPEPTTLIILGLGVPVLLRRRRRLDR